MILYYLPAFAKGMANESDLKAMGLGHVIRGEIGSRRLERGPDGGAGLLVSSGPDAGRNTYDAAGQTWQRCGAVWIGWAIKPTEATLRRASVNGTATVRLRDGADWTLPTLSPLPDKPMTVPSVYGIDAEGNWGSRPVPEFAGVCDSAFRYWRHWCGQETAKYTTADALDLAAGALGINYHVGKLEVGILGLVDDETLRLILRALIEADEIEARAKKASAAVTLPSDSGEPAAIVA